MVRVSRRKEALKPTQEDDQQHVILQLPITPNRVEAILDSNNSQFGEPSGTGADLSSYHLVQPTAADGPLAYQPVSGYESCLSDPAESLVSGNPYIPVEKETCCFWCCHPVSHIKVGLPIRYDASSGTYITTGCFCSYECAAAYNFEKNYGTDAMWEIHSWLQVFAEKAGLPTPIRPAPSRYTLQEFGGPMNIHEFRTVHKTSDKFVLCNIPPLITVMPQTETVNTSYLTPHIDMDRLHQAHEKLLIKKKTNLTTETKNGLDSKLKLTFTIGDAAPASK